MKPHPVLLAPDNFTPQARTPWGGRRIVSSIKSALGLPAQVVGESWEISVEPDFPSRGEDGRSLEEIVQSAQAAWLGSESQRGGTALLVKLLDASDELSVQIHPSDDYAGLRDGEGGKPESWYIVDREPGAGLYLGLAEGVDEDTMRTALESGDDVSKLLGFIEVEPGDFFLIEAGTAHAIGRGLTLVEPQFVAPGKRGLTYRFWDWNRRYDAAGKLDSDGAPRALHIDHALAVTNWNGARGREFIAAIRIRAGLPDLDAPANEVLLAGPRGGLASAYLDVSRVSGTGLLEVELGCLRGITVVDGRVTVVGDGTRLDVERGRSAVIPATFANGRCRLELNRAHALLTATP